MISEDLLPFTQYRQTDPNPHPDEYNPHHNNMPLFGPFQGNYAMYA